MARRVARSVDQIEHLVGVGQTHDQRRIAPHAPIGNVHAPLALTQRSRDRSIHIHVGLGQEPFGLLGPHPLACPIDALLQGENVLRLETPREISSRGGIGNPLSAQAIHIVFVLPAQSQVLQSSSAGQNVVGKVQDMIAFVIGQMDFEQVQMRVDLLHQTQPLGQCMHGTQAPTADRAGSLGDFIMNLAAVEQGLGLIDVIPFAKPTRDSLLVLTERLSVGILHSQCAFSVLG